MRICGSLSLLFASLLLITFCLVMQAHASSTWNIQIVDTKANVGGCSIALDSADNPHIAYSDYVNDNVNLMYASWNGSDWNIQTVDSSGAPGSNSLALDSSNNPHISYYDIANENLKYAYWTGSNWSTQTVDPSRGAGSLALDSHNNPHISYSMSNYLMYAWWNGSDWSIQNVDSSVAFFSNGYLALDASGTPHISYFDFANAVGYSSGDTKYAYWTGSTWNIQTVDSNENIISPGPIALDSGGNPHISYFRAHPGQVTYSYGALMYAKLAESTPLSASQLTVIIAVVVVVVILAVLLLVYRTRTKGAKKSPRTPSPPQP